MSEYTKEQMDELNAKLSAMHDQIVAARNACNLALDAMRDINAMQTQAEIEYLRKKVK